MLDHPDGSLTWVEIDTNCWLRDQLGLLIRAFPWGLGFLIAWQLGSKGKCLKSKCKLKLPVLLEAHN